jgi:hypothetical protein
LVANSTAFFGSRSLVLGQLASRAYLALVQQSVAMLWPSD